MSPPYCQSIPHLYDLDNTADSCRWSDAILWQIYTSPTVYIEDED